jgi:hypothetical protein
MRHILAQFRPALRSQFLVAGLALAALSPALPVAAGAGAEPVLPVTAPEIARLDLGVFCAWQQMDRAPAPGTESGWIHVPMDKITFQWPDRQVVPAVIGMGFGIEVTGAKGFETAVGEARVYRPGRNTPEVWASDLSDFGPTLAFFRFDTAAELIPGRWVFEGWDRDRMLYRVEFEVVPAAALPGVAGACDAVS